MRAFVSEAFILAALTLLFYLYAYFFEIGYAAWFQYPPEVIGPTLSSLAGSWILLLFVLLFGFLQLNLQYWPHLGRWKAGFTIALIFYVFVSLTAMAAAPSWAFGIVGVLSSAIAICANWLYNRKLRRQVAATGETITAKGAVGHMSPELKEKFTVYDRLSSIPTYSIAYNLIKKFGQDPLIYALLFLIIAPSTCFYAGFTQALGKHDFYLIGGDPNDAGDELVIRIINGIVISAPFDPATKRYEVRYRIRLIGELDTKSVSPVHFDRSPLWK